MTKISTSNLAGLPLPGQLERLLKSLAVLDAILSPEWEYRYYSFDAKWSATETMGSMRNGSGDDLFVLFNEAGCFVKGFSHEHWSDELRRADFYKDVPAVFTSGVSEPAFTPQNVTFCLWARHGETTWHHAVVALPTTDDPDGSEFLLSDLDGRAETYQKFAQEYYEKQIPLDAVRSIYNHIELTDEIVRSLNPDLSLADLGEELAAAGYPDA